MYILGLETASTSGGSQTAGRPCQRICTSKYLVSFDSFLYNISVSKLDAALGTWAIMVGVSLPKPSRHTEINSKYKGKPMIC